LLGNSEAFGLGSGRVSENQWNDVTGYCFATGNIRATNSRVTKLQELAKEGATGLRNGGAANGETTTKLVVWISTGVRTGFHINAEFLLDIPSQGITYRFAVKQTNLADKSSDGGKEVAPLED
jgi:hypothetical protein